MIRYKAIISYPEIVKREGIMLQRGMNFRVNLKYSIILMSVRKGAPYNDQWHDDTGLLEYEGHDVPRRGDLDPKAIDQPMEHPGGRLTENGKFYQAARAYKEGHAPADIVQVYEKIAQGIWSNRGRFELVDATMKSDGTRNVFRFFLRPTTTPAAAEPILRDSRVIPTAVKVEVWRRDHGRCVLCGSRKNLHFDHDVPYSKGGSSITTENVRLLCAKHNLEKSNRIMSVAPWFLGVTAAIISRSA
ncbi:MAG: HNH endonuclease [Planctomycetes bacterium]|nr:HNH endonuclease [Planctomycetota bacterium]